ncbi:hypothetical protein EDI_110470 [Entamoeba dispar SAW760]|uniref:Uncharacterized protein n=1 Tax=Entamoeba dispar (strain ATCC PRA-260 / SAW760) TaxID=370354 RepID=B0EK37_ENTDS|nr:uncharacterized protein EDI_110470 [Entamoeba dispar SAW760]EDR25105.1 hypothetical protein EDI_110470 [Entamoeba dispar SAW760]|eukprot:EDR25105.1 hypothetical protein EDI_110470 [Entamoeba dispar SAW760]
MSMKTKPMQSKVSKQISIQNQRLYVICGCYYLIMKGWTILFSSEKRSAKSYDHFFPINKMWDKNGVLVFSDEKDYEIETLPNGSVVLILNDEGIPISIENQNRSRMNNKKYKEIVIMNILNAFYNKFEKMDARGIKIISTKKSNKNLSSFRYQLIPLVNEEGELVNFVDYNKMKDTIGTPMYRLLCSLLMKKRGQGPPCKYLLVGNESWLNEQYQSICADNQGTCLITKNRLVHLIIFCPCTCVPPIPIMVGTDYRPFCDVSRVKFIHQQQEVYQSTSQILKDQSNEYDPDKESKTDTLYCGIGFIQRFDDTFE